MAHIRRLDTGHWQARYRGPDGRERARNFALRGDAEKFLVGAEASKMRGEWIEPAAGRVSIAEWSATWLSSIRHTLKPKTIAGYESLLRSRVVPAFGAFPLAAIRPTDVQAWIGGMQESELSASRIRQAHVVLKCMLDAAVRDGLIGRNVANGTRLPRVERREAPYFDPRVVESIISSAPVRYRPFLEVQGVLGLRFGEAAALRRRSVNGLRRRLRVEESLAEIGGRLIFGSTKTHAARTVPLPGSLARSLAHHMENVVDDPDALLFPSARGFPLRYSRFRPTVWLPVLDQLGLPQVGIHALRHSAAARMIAAGWSPKAVQHVMGHGSAAFTLTVYGHLFEDDLDALGEALDGGSRGFLADSTEG